MSGAAAVNYLLSNSANLIAAVPAARILTAATLPLGTSLPAITISSISDSERLDVAMPNSTKKFRTERVQVLVHAADSAQLASILALVRHALPNTRGTVNGVALDSILPELVGPDLSQPEASIYERARDFIVKWHGPSS